MQSLVESLGAHAARSPDAVALVDGDARVSYGELLDRSGAIARGLRSAGIGPGDRVASLLGHTADSVALIYGAWIAGAVLVPLSHQARPSEVGPLVGHAGARLLVHEPGYRDAASVLGLGAAHAARCVTLQDLASVSAGERVESVVPGGLGSLAMLLYTSGTSGRPKAVMLSHANLAANVSSIVDYLSLNERDAVLSVLPFNYSYGSSVLHTHLAAGARVVLERNLVFPQVIVDTMKREGVTGFSGVPSTFALLLSRSDLARAGLHKLRYVTQAGAAMSLALKQQLQEALPHTRIFVMYGQTEATARLSFVPPERLSEKLASAGIPVPGVELTVRDQSGRSLGAFETGEIWARGPNVMLGYWNDEPATREVLRDGWLRTGDMGYMDGDGYLFIEGRRSDMIKTGAHRVHPLEVEEVISDVPGVREVAVAGVDDEILGQAVAAFVVVDPDFQLKPERIQARCRERLSPHKVPKSISFVGALPRTGSGKLRRAELTGLRTERAK